MHIVSLTSSMISKWIFCQFLQLSLVFKKFQKRQVKIVLQLGQIATLVVNHQECKMYRKPYESECIS